MRSPFIIMSPKILLIKTLFDFMNKIKKTNNWDNSFATNISSLTGLKTFHHFFLK